MVTMRPEIFQYLDYRPYLRDFYVASKEGDPGFSFRSFSKSAGLRSFNYLKLVMEGRRRLSETFFAPFAKALRLRDSEKAYFAKLIEFSDARDARRKSTLLNELLALRPRTKVHTLSRAALNICSEWYYIPLIELTGVDGFRNDPTWIAGRLGLKVPTVKRALRELLAHGLLERSEGSLTKTNRLADTPDEVSSLLVRTYHQKTLNMAASAVFDQELHEREFGSMSFVASDEQLLELKRRIKEFRREIFHYLDRPAEKPGSEVYQLNVQLFRVTKKGKKGVPHEKPKHDRSGRLPVADRPAAAASPRDGLADLAYGPR